MKIAITGGTGFVGRHLARRLSQQGHEVVLIARGRDQRDLSVRELPGVHLAEIGLGSVGKLQDALAGCDVVAHCAGINRELGAQNYQRVHIDGTRNLIAAARQSGVQKILLLSFLRARPACGSGYHESKWAAEELVRNSGLDFTILKAGVIYGRGDHMLDHLSRALQTFPVFGLVGLKPTSIRPVAVEDVVHVIGAALIENRLSRQTLALLGPEEMVLSEAVRRVGAVLGKRPLYLRLPLWFHYALGWFCERIMKVPLVSLGQVRILSEGVTEPLPPCDSLQEDIRPRTAFTPDQIRVGLPEARRFGWQDLRWSRD